MAKKGLKRFSDISVGDPCILFKMLFFCSCYCYFFLSIFERIRLATYLSSSRSIISRRHFKLAASSENLPSKNGQVQIILHMRKVSSGHLFSIDTFCNIQLFY